MKKKILITWPLPDAVMARARATYDVIAHGDNPKITIDEMLETAKSVDAILLTLNEKCRADVIERVPENIKCISTFSIGFDHIDLEACKKRGIKVGNAPHGVTVATAEIAMLLLLGSARRAAEGERMIRTQSWPGWQPLQLVGQRLDNKMLGIYGFGKIGQALAQRARGFDMDIHYYDIYRAKPEVEAKYNAIYHDSLDSLLERFAVLLHQRAVDAGDARLLQQGDDREAAAGRHRREHGTRRSRQGRGHDRGLEVGTSGLRRSRRVRRRAQDQRGLLRPAQHVPVPASGLGGDRGTQPDGL